MIMDGQFLVRQIYEDELTYNIVGAAEKVLSKLLLSFATEFSNRICIFICKRNGSSIDYA